jgi:hypothetical protein
MKKENLGKKERIKQYTDEVNRIIAGSGDERKPDHVFKHSWTSCWRRSLPRCSVVRSPKEYSYLMKTLIETGKHADVVVIDWNDEEQSIEWLKFATKMMQISRIQVGQYYQTFQAQVKA